MPENKPSVSSLTVNWKNSTLSITAVLFSHWEPLSSCRPHLCTCCCYRQHGGIPAHTTQQMFMTVYVCQFVCMHQSACFLRSNLCTFVCLSESVFLCVCVNVCMFVDKASCPSTSLAIWISDCLPSLKRKSRECVIMGHFLNACVFICFPRLFYLCGELPVVMMIMKRVL